MDVRWIGTWHDPAKEKEAAASLFDAGADVVFTGADTPAVADVAQEKGKWGVTYDHPGLLPGRRLPDGAVLDLGPGVQAHRRAGQGQHLQGRLRVLRRRLEGHGPVRLHGRPDAAAGHRRPAGRGRPDGQGHAGQDAGRRHSAASTSSAGPINDNTGNVGPGGRREARAVRPRPVPATPAARQLHVLHELARRRHQRHHPGLRSSPRPSSAGPSADAVRARRSPSCAPRCVNDAGHR